MAALTEFAASLCPTPSGGFVVPLTPAPLGSALWVLTDDELFAVGAVVDGEAVDSDDLLALAAALLDDLWSGVGALVAGRQRRIVLASR